MCICIFKHTNTYTDTFCYCIGLSNLEILSDLSKWLTVQSLLPPAGSVQVWIYLFTYMYTLILVLVYSYTHVCTQNQVQDFELISLIGFFGGILSQFVREYGDVDGGAELDELQSTGRLIYEYIYAYTSTYLNTNICSFHTFVLIYV